MDEPIVTASEVDKGKDVNLVHPKVMELDINEGDININQYMDLNVKMS